MPQYIALIYTPDLDWTAPEQAAGWRSTTVRRRPPRRSSAAGTALYPTATATTVRVSGGKGGDVVTTDGPYAETKEVLTGFYLLECADLDEAIAVAAQIPAAWDGAVEVRPVIESGGDRARPAAGIRGRRRRRALARWSGTRAGGCWPRWSGSPATSTLAEDAVQDAVVRALEAGPATASRPSRAPG